nr:MAG: esterase [Betaproteobacteria bacterium RIFCSPLOWO2_02_67_12]OGA30352.1 MAG: esterase [Betaproteobacteria bacterium RIFCSPLOWO2_02_FULL_68_150]OGA72371.1 MAG: esterase [Betaproteobacteria bacterium RIFCSPLOWO2_12_FULL_67_28]
MILYLHGFNSAPASHKARALRSHLEARGLAHQFACPALPHRPAAAIALIESEIGRCGGRPTLVGSSLGGFYATHFAERLDLRAVLINPAIRPHIGLEPFLGTQQNLYTGATYELTRADLEGWRAIVVEQVDPERYLLLLETGDEVLDWREAARKYEGARTVIRDGGDHTLQSFAEHIPRLLAFAGLQARA